MSSDPSSHAEDRPANSQIALTSSLYGELHKLAAICMAREYEPQTLQATALLHEAWIRVGGSSDKEWNNRKHYYSAIAEAMRYILVDRARRRQAIRHGGALHRVELQNWNWENLEDPQALVRDRILLTMNDALQQLSEEDHETAQVVKLYYFAGLSVEETAREIGLSRRTTERRLSFARGWLSGEIRDAMAT